MNSDMKMVKEILIRYYNISLISCLFNRMEMINDIYFDIFGKYIE